MLPTLNQLSALVSVVIIDVVLAGDNAIVVGMAAAALPPERRRRAILAGIAAATVLRIVFAAIALRLLDIVGLGLAGGLLLLWVAWKLYRELRQVQSHGVAAHPHAGAASPPDKTMLQAVTQIQEQTLAFVPKLVGVSVVFLIALPWVMQLLVKYTTELFRSLPSLIS